MADYTIRSRTFVRHEYVLPNPTNWAELGKALASLEQSLPSGVEPFDNSVRVEADDAEIVLYWQEEIRG